MRIIIVKHICLLLGGLVVFIGVYSVSKPYVNTWRATPKEPELRLEMNETMEVDESLHTNPEDIGVETVSESVTHSQMDSQKGSVISNLRIIGSWFPSNSKWSEPDSFALRLKRTKRSLDNINRTLQEWDADLARIHEKLSKERSK